MKKLILLLLSANFTTINVAQILGCDIFEKNTSEKKPKPKKHKPKKPESIKPDRNKPKSIKPDRNKPDQTNDNIKYIVDFETTNKPLAESSLSEYKGWAGTLKSKDSMEIFLKNKVVPYVSFNSEQQKFIEKFTTVLNTPASKKSIEKFNKFQEEKTFKTFNELVDTINLHNQEHFASYIDVPLELIKDHTNIPVGFEEVLLKIYNTFSYFFGKNYGYKIVRVIAVGTNMFNKNNKKRRGAARNEAAGKLIQIDVDEEALTYNESKMLKEWKLGRKVTPKNYKTFVHEFGHALNYIHNIKFPFYKEIDSLSGLDAKNSSELVTSNKYKMEYCNNFIKDNKTCPYKISPKFDKSKITSSLNPYSNAVGTYANLQPDIKRSNLIELLEKFILDKVKNLKIPGKNPAEKDNFIKTMLVKIFINSDYGRSKENDGEVPSEGFEYWLLADEKFRDKAWEIWNEFFLEYLPAWRNTLIYFK